MESAIPATEFRKDFKELLNRVEFRGQRIRIERHGKVAAVLVSVADLELLERIEDERDIALAERVMNEDDGTRISLDDAKKHLGL